MSCVVELRFVQQGPNHGCTGRLESGALRQNSRRCGRIYSYSRGTAENGELSIDKAADVEQARSLHARAAYFAAAALGLLTRQITPPTSSLTSRSEEHPSELQSLMRISYAVFCLKTKKTTQQPYKAPV